MIFLFLRSRSAAAVHVRRLRALGPKAAGMASAVEKRRADKPRRRKAEAGKKRLAE